MQEFEEEKEKRSKEKKKIRYHIADLKSKFFEKHSQCRLKMVIVILWRTINIKPK